MNGILTGKGINAQRSLLSGETNHDDAINDVLTSASPQFLHRAVVHEVIFDPVNMSKELIEKYPDIINVDLLHTLPRNSILAIVISRGAAKRSPRPAVFYPFFSHMHQPIKPGEKVWVVFEDNHAHDLGYWFSRIVERRDVEDPNFTHGDRIFVDQLHPSTIERADLGSISPPGPPFPNGSDTVDGYTLEEPDAFEKIEKEAIANRVSVREPVPRYTKRPNDWVAEGSNNSLLVLGDDRTTSAGKVIADKLNGKPEKDKASAAGMFNLVAGRGIGTARKLPAPGAKPTQTAPGVVKNARGLLETDKNIDKESPSEGDIDFEFDAAYVYGAMDTNVDENFGKALPKLSGNIEPEKVDKGSAVIAKANHVRVIAREDGTIRIIKEGILDDESGRGHAGILIEKDGTIFIDSPRIVIGSGIQKNNGAGTQFYLGRDATEPVVLGLELKKLLTDYTEDVKSAIDAWIQSMAAWIEPSTAPSPAHNFGNFGIPIPGLIFLASTWKQANANLNKAISDADLKLESNVDKTLSKNGKTK